MSEAVTPPFSSSAGNAVSADESREPAPGGLRGRIAARPWAGVLIGTLGAVGALMGTYACRKPVAAGIYEGVWAGHDFKALLVLCQLIGYATSKFLAVRVVPRMSGPRRLPSILGLVTLATLALFVLPLIPAPWSAGLMVINGLSLGIIWALIFSCLEGRRVTDLLTVALALALVISTGVTKGSALALRSAVGCSEIWTPALTAVAFAPLFFASIWLLTLLPPVTAADRCQTGVRKPMTSEEIVAFRRRWGRPLMALIGVMAVLTLFRDMRETFMVDIFKEAGVTLDFSKLAGIELKVALGAGIPFFAVWFIRNNRHAFIICCLAVAVGAALVGVATAAHAEGAISTGQWLLYSGIGLCMGYFPFNCLLFDRLFSMLRTPGTVTYVLTQADAWGYLLSCGVVFIKSVGVVFVWTNALTQVAMFISAVVPLAIFLSMRYFLKNTAEA